MNSRFLAVKHNILCNIIEKDFGIDGDSLKIKTRKREIVQLRRVMYFILKKHTICPLREIGEIVGNQDHATVLHAIREHHKMVEMTGKNGRLIYEEYVAVFNQVYSQFLDADSDDALELKERIFFLKKEKSRLEKEIELLEILEKEMEEELEEEIVEA